MPAILPAKQTIFVREDFVLLIDAHDRLFEFEFKNNIWQESFSGVRAQHVVFYQGERSEDFSILIYGPDKTLYVQGQYFNEPLYTQLPGTHDIDDMQFSQIGCFLITGNNTLYKVTSTKQLLQINLFGYKLKKLCIRRFTDRSNSQITWQEWGISTDNKIIYTTESRVALAPMGETTVLGAFNVNYLRQEYTFFVLSNQRLAVYSPVLSKLENIHDLSETNVIEGTIVNIVTRNINDIYVLYTNGNLYRYLLKRDIPSSKLKATLVSEDNFSVTPIAGPLVEETNKCEPIRDIRAVIPAGQPTRQYCQITTYGGKVYLLKSQFGEDDELVEYACFDVQPVDILASAEFPV